MWGAAPVESVLRVCGSWVPSELLLEPGSHEALLELAFRSQGAEIRESPPLTCCWAVQMLSVALFMCPKYGEWDFRLGNVLTRWVCQ